MSSCQNITLMGGSHGSNNYRTNRKQSKPALTSRTFSIRIFNLEVQSGRAHRIREAGFRRDWTRNRASGFFNYALLVHPSRSGTFRGFLVWDLYADGGSLDHDR